MITKEKALNSIKAKNKGYRIVLLLLQLNQFNSMDICKSLQTSCKMLSKSFSCLVNLSAVNLHSIHSSLSCFINPLRHLIACCFIVLIPFFCLVNSAYTLYNKLDFLFCKVSTLNIFTNLKSVYTIKEVFYD